MNADRIASGDGVVFTEDLEFDEGEDPADIAGAFLREKGLVK